MTILFNLHYLQWLDWLLNFIFRLLLGCCHLWLEWICPFNLEQLFLIKVAIEFVLEKQWEIPAIIYKSKLELSVKVLSSRYKQRKSSQCFSSSVSLWARCINDVYFHKNTPFPIHRSLFAKICISSSVWSSVRKPSLFQVENELKSLTLEDWVRTSVISERFRVELLLLWIERNQLNC